MKRIRMSKSNRYIEHVSVEKPPYMRLMCPQMSLVLGSMKMLQVVDPCEMCNKLRRNWCLTLLLAGPGGIQTPLRFCVCHCQTAGDKELKLSDF